MSRNEREEPYTNDETKEIKWLQRVINSFTETQYKKFHENGFDYLPSPIVTAGAPDEFKFMKWGLIPFYMSDKAKALALRASTLNCISEEMYDKPSFKDAAKNSQRCLIPVTGFYEWRWLDEKGKTKIPYYVSFKEQPIMSVAGLYSRWKDRSNDEYYYSYTVLTTAANPMMEYIHNSKRRMPVFIPKEYERDWLNKSLSKDDVLALCQPFKGETMKANTISKLITTKEADTNVEDVLKLHQYEKVSTDEIVAEL
jgi:putative SOS response-associated peptidase YedK